MIKTGQQAKTLATIATTSSGAIFQRGSFPDQLQSASALMTTILAFRAEASIDPDEKQAS